ncbi:MAG: HAD hydrolase-like protein [Symploca sp. SIO3C6]|nr:HAD hydrolase-like protein [Symploca sp. SIO3C6]
MTSQSTVVFDMIGTCFSLEKPKQRLMELGAPAEALSLWFAQTLRDAFALSHAGGYQPLKQILEAELPRTIKLLGLKADNKQLAEVIATFSELELQTGALATFQSFKAAGWRIVALTNGSAESTRQLLAQGRALEYFSELFSCDQIQKTKPHPDVYLQLPRNSEGDTWMIAAHAWDIMGAIGMGWKTAFLTYEEQDYLDAYPQPDVIANNLLEAANKILV